MSITIAELLTKRFMERPLEERIKIVSQGKPRSILNSFTERDSEDKSINKSCDPFKWFTRSESDSNIYCWPCLLFPVDDNKNGTFISNSENSNLHSNLLEHAQSSAHQTGLLQYILFENQHLPGIEEPGDFAKEVWRVKKNRFVIKYLIDVCLLMQPYSLPRKESDCVLRVENCVRILTLMKKHGAHIIDDAITLVKADPTILMDITAAVSLHIREAIKAELQSAASIALIVSEHSTVENNSKISTVVRYVYNGNVCERLIDLTNSNSVEKIKCNQYANLISKRISKLISELDASGKFVALSLNGAVLPTSALSDFVKSLQEQYPSCFFAPCHFHQFNLVLEQSLSTIPECQQFFENLNIINVFFQDDKVKAAFKIFTNDKIPYPSILKLSNSQFLRALKIYRSQFRNFFLHIEEHHEMWSADNVVKASGFLTFLEEYQTLFLLETFYMLFDHIAFLSEMLNSSCPESVFDKYVLLKIKLVLTKDKNNGFENLWTRVINALLKDSKPEVLQSAGEEETEELLELYKKIVDCIIDEIEIRFSDAGRLEFMSALNCEPNSRLIFSDYEMRKLSKLQGVDKNGLKKELKLLSRNGAIFGGKSVHELKDILLTAGLDKTCKSVYELAELILTMPCKPGAPKGITSATIFDLINAWTSVIPATGEMNSLSHLCIEKDLLKHLKSRPEFYDQVILNLKDSNIVKLLKLVY